MGPRGYPDPGLQVVVGAMTFAMDEGTHREMTDEPSGALNGRSRRVFLRRKPVWAYPPVEQPTHQMPALPDRQLVILLSPLPGVQGSMHWGLLRP